MRFWRSRWWMPALSIALGAVLFAAFSAGGNSADGAKSFGVMVFVAVLFAVGGARSETVAGLGGASRDERWAFIDLRATAFSGLVLVLAVISSWIYEIADGQDGSPYGQLAAIGGLAYVLGVAVLQRRS
jgi:hypothetical protein